MPAPTTDDAEECGVLFQTAEAILSGAWRGLIGIDSTLGIQIDTYVSLGVPPADCCNQLVIWMSSFGPTARAYANSQRSASPDRVWPVCEASYTMQFWLGGYPIITAPGDNLRVPQPGALHQYNRRLYRYGLAMYDGVITDYVKGRLFVESTTCPKLTFGALTPLAPQGACAGWSFAITGDLDA